MTEQQALFPQQEASDLAADTLVDLGFIERESPGKVRRFALAGTIVASVKCTGYWDVVISIGFLQQFLNPGNTSDAAAMLLLISMIDLVRKRVAKHGTISVRSENLQVRVTPR